MPTPFPDPDCPPHFYAHGHNPQYRHFAALMGYMNRVADLVSGGRAAQAAVLYHGEAEWAGKAMLTQKPARKLAEAQIEYDCIPCDVFANPERYNTRLGNPLRVNTQTYRVLVVPRAQFVTACFARAAAELHAAGLPVLFVDGLPEGICDGEDSLLEPLKDCAVIALEQLAGELAKLSLPEAVFAPQSVYLRAMRCQGDWGLFFFVNEGTRTYTGTVTVPYTGPCYWYDAWRNVTYSASGTASGGSMALALTLEPGHSLILMLDEPDEERLTEPVRCEGVKLPLAG